MFWYRTLRIDHGFYGLVRKSLGAKIPPYFLRSSSVFLVIIHKGMPLTRGTVEVIFCLKKTGTWKIQCLFFLLNKKILPQQNIPKNSRERASRNF